MPPFYFQEERKSPPKNNEATFPETPSDIHHNSPSGVSVFYDQKEIESASWLESIRNHFGGGGYGIYEEGVVFIKIRVLLPAKRGMGVG